jgi:spore germination protein KB
MRAKISRLQLFLIIPNMLFGKAIGITSGIISRKIGGDVWISMAIGFIVGCLIIILLTYIASKFPDKTMIGYSEELLGKWSGKIIGIIIIVFFIIAYATSANVMILHLKDYFLIETPIIVLCFAYTLLCTYGVYLGIEVVARFSLMGFIMLILITLAMIIGTIGDFKLTNLQPLMEKGLVNDFGGSVYLFTDLAYAIFTIGIIYPMVNIKKNIMKLSTLAILLSGVMVILWPIFEVGVMGPSVMNSFVVVCMEQIRCAQFTKYLPRYELLMVVFYVFSIFIQSSILFYCAAHGIKQVLNSKKNKNLNKYIILVLFVILSLLTYFMGHNENLFVNFLSYPWSQICALLSIGLPLLLFIVALTRGRLKKQNPK